jgi:hypothetical protein
MISIITAENKELLEHHMITNEHVCVLWLPENDCHKVVEAKKIIDFIQDNKGCQKLEIYTLRDLAVNIVGHFISRNIIEPKDVTITILPDNDIYLYEKRGFIQNWRWGFYEWDYKDLPKE